MLYGMRDFELRGLVLWMLQKDPARRPTLREVMEHPYFANVKIEWERIKDKSYILSYIPEIHSTMSIPRDPPPPKIDGDKRDAAGYPVLGDTVRCPFFSPMNYDAFENRRGGGTLRP
ncbi:hypothetical protein PUNSTDRAFT_121210 [Punctularia strigosozonata HHB-11173 SS5]|uniref:uncharacterized protein n=1 Tax=Punctularia strigosozonata (strain HHB-11173) TaxID=741275 RepID=UPI0004416F47|nr:uncharacterized protein PUNSTDRAFT_121210 [Punctularia strigosozonata HHB-11173 SS5]EIN08106.1 hypothetical protein PUNSTDRAFT_121210 [Punctularia strigosozonata HHB-11173 SS5]